MMTGSDSWVAAIDAIGALSPSQQQSTFDSIGSETLSNITSMAALQGYRFNDLLRDRATYSPLNSGDISTVASVIGGSATQGVLRAAQPPASQESGLSGDGSALSGWIQTFGVSGRLDASFGTATVDNFSAGIAVGLEVDTGDIKFGVAGAVSDVESNVDTRLSHNEGKLYQSGGYVYYDNGNTFANLVGSYFEGDVDTVRSVFIGLNLFGTAKGETNTRGFTAGALSLDVTKEARELFSTTGEMRLSHPGETANGGVVEPYASVGVRFNFGDLDTLSSTRFSGAPVGTGAFVIEGARLSKASAIFGGGIIARPTDNVAIGVDVGSSISERE